LTPEKFIKTYESALASQDWQKISPLIHDDACVTFNNGTYQGKAEVKQAFQKTFDLIKDEEYAIKNISWIKKTELIAVCMFNFEWRGIIHGKPAQGSGRGTSVLIHENNHWQLLTEHLGPNPI
tara:strand:+ start:1107 stop:1475 length:369 start_codon:yes stop_codon:yes gene_type:complete